MLSLLLCLVLLCVVAKTLGDNQPAFDSAKLVIDGSLTKQAYDFNISFRPTRIVGNNEVVVVRLPRFTNGFIENSTATNVTFGSVIISPSYNYQAKFVAGISINDDAGTVPFASSELHIRPTFNDTFQKSTEYTFTIYKENGIGAVCGFPSSEVANTSGKFVYPYKPFEIFTVSNMTEERRNDSYEFDFYTGMGVGCSTLNNCQMQGQCDYCYERCHCFEGLGSQSDLITTGRNVLPDCSSRVCPAGKAFGDIPSAADAAHALAECSNQGLCNRATGECQCFSPFIGSACEKMSCPNDCSSHGQCLSMAEMARLRYNVDPTKNANFEYGSINAFATTAWDHDVVHGCMCDSTWPVGYADGETQLAEYFGGDCSQKRCPSGDDPYTTLDETNCHGKSQLPSAIVSANSPPIPDPEKGKRGNKCYVECSNRGVCDYQTGVCDCFSGSWGQACENIANAGRRHWDSGSDEDSFWLASVNTSIIVEGN